MNLNKIKEEGIIFQGCDELSYNRFIQEHCKLITLDKISTFFKPPFSYLLHKVECLIFGLFPNSVLTIDMINKDKYFIFKSWYTYY